MRVSTARYEKMFREILAGLCANPYLLKNDMRNGTIVELARVMTEQAFDKIEEA